ncbi:RTA1 like protein [Penicillium brevicompactum]|uniref:RTA1 like protein n=1 Tax=Penicillium brevicompactum TaxID=5074 RepID=A0A9W9RB71_PENBR|nr:RTA1 like protein [Penicillium brevicompactum]
MNYYDYTPSLAAAVIFCTLFGSINGYHFWLLFRNRTWFFIVFGIGGLCLFLLSKIPSKAWLILTFVNTLVETVGYGARAISANQSPDYTLLPFLVQNLLILLAPSLFAASIYMLLGRIIRITDGDSRSLIRSGGMLSGAKTASQLSLGKKVIITGLVVQVLFFGLFVIIASVFHKRLNERPTSASSDPQLPWRQYLKFLYIASGLVLVRCLYRVVEYASSSKSFKSNEIYA